LEEEQRIARQQLRQVLNYADATTCRRAAQLQYFGETLTGNCRACDNCCEPRTAADWTVQAQQFLSCIARLAQRNERYGAAYLIEILRGSQSERVTSRGHAELSVYGIGKQHSVDEWRDIARALLHQGLISETQDGYSVLSLNTQSWEVLRGQRDVQIAVAPKPERGRKSKTKSAAAPVSPEHDALFEQLRALRKQLADKAGVPPYVVFHDATLREMAAQKPSTLAAFAKIPGVGQAKLTRYGEVFMQAIEEADS
jgi:ATP-dependent DNA helicase RecQ